MKMIKKAAGNVATIRAGSGQDCIKKAGGLRRCISVDILRMAQSKPGGQVEIIDLRNKIKKCRRIN